MGVWGFCVCHLKKRESWIIISDELDLYYEKNRGIFHYPESLGNVIVDSIEYKFRGIVYGASIESVLQCPDIFDVYPVYLPDDLDMLEKFIMDNVILTPYFFGSLRVPENRYRLVMDVVRSFDKVFSKEFDVEDVKVRVSYYEGCGVIVYVRETYGKTPYARTCIYSSVFSYDVPFSKVSFGTLCLYRDLPVFDVLRW